MHGNSGIARGQFDSFFDEISSVRYNAIGASVSQPNSVLSGDNLTIFASQPTAINSGYAKASLNVAQSGSEANYAQVDIPLAPTYRETEIGFEYTAQGVSGLEWSLKVSRRFNASNVSRNDVDGFALGFRKSF